MSADQIGGTGNREPGFMEDALRDPASKFDSPDAVIADTRLSKDQKHAILIQWKADAEALQRAASEAMMGGEDADLADVNKALDALGED